MTTMDHIFIGFFCLLPVAFVTGIGCITLGVPPWGIFRSKVMTNRQFDLMLDLVFNDPNFRSTRFEVMGGGYTIWYCNNYYGFKVNDVMGFSAYQKYKFFKRHNALRAAGRRKHLEEKLKLKQLSPTGQVLYGKPGGK